MAAALAAVLGGSAQLPLVRSRAAAADTVLLSAAGDIDGCAAGEDTAALIKKVAGPVATIGDNAYPEGSASDYSRCYAPSWGTFKDRTHPVPGNHDYDASRATPYYQYFGGAAGEAGSGWYSYDLGAWHVVALNSNCGNVDCTKQTNWLDADLAAHPSACILAYWHHPRFSSGTSGGDSDVGAFWKVLYAHGATLVLNGHDHDYERFAPQDPTGHADPARGIRQFIVGTGGAALGSLAGSAANSQVRNNRTYGVLQLTLRPGGYDWRFVAAAGGDFNDSGTDTCRGTAPPPTTVAPATPPADAAPAPAAPSDGSGPASSPGGPAPGSGSPDAGSPDAGSPDAGSPDAGPPSPGPRGSGGPDGGPRRTPGPRSAAPAPARGSTAGSGSGRGGPPTTRTGEPMTSPRETVPPAPEAGAAADPSAGAPPAPATPEENAPPAAELVAGSSPDGQPFTAAIAGLIHGPAPRRHLDRRGAALLAVVLLAGDGLAIAALRRGLRQTP